MDNNLIEREINEALSSAFLEYAGYNLQRRAIPDARDGLKWGARQLLHAQMLGKFTYDKPFKKAIKSVAQAMGFSYVHGDASAYGTFIRMAKPFAMNVPLQEANGNYGTLIDPDDHSASRYVELRGSEAASYLLADLDKGTINEWEDTYDLEGKFPKVLPAKGFWNIVNGCISIGSGMSCSIAPTNIKEVNEALVKILNNPNVSDDEIICMPDFPTGATLLNAAEVRESLKKGNGAACKIRATIEYDSKERCLIVKEMPYSVYTNVVCKELAVLMSSDEDCGIKDVVDYTKQEPDLRIYLNKKANPDKVLRRLYKETSLQSYFSINMTALDHGVTPRLFTWRELCDAYLEHQKTIYTKGYEFDLRKINSRIHIINGLLKAINTIDEVIKLIRAASTTKEASAELQKFLEIDEIQAKAILDIKLSRLAHMEVTKLQKEWDDLTVQKSGIEAILGNEFLLKKEIEKGLLEVSKKFGDARRTKILNIENENDEPTEVRSLLINLTNKNNLFVSEASSLYTQKRGGVGTKFKLEEGEFVVSTTSAETTDTILFFTQKGNFYHYSAGALIIDEKIPVESLFMIHQYEKVCAMTAFNRKNSKQNIIFFTKNGILKKSLLSEYNVKRAVGMKALELDEGDEIRSVLFVNDEKVGILTVSGQFLICETNTIRAIGRTARGVGGIKLNDGDELISARPIPKDIKEFISISGDGYIKRTSSSEFTVTGRYTKGGKLQKLKDSSDYMIDFLPITTEKEIFVISRRAQIKLKVDDISLLSKNTQGTKSIKLGEKDTVIGLSKI